jgi:hypothetical protein
MLSLNCKNMQHVKIYLPCNFEVNPITHFDRLCKLEKRGDEIKKIPSPLKLLSQSQPNFAEMILGRRKVLKLKLEAPRSLYSSPGYNNNISQ